ncbi:MAG: hypothetical protein LC649_04615 [Bacteroidales bacterium]|nr:hypothetical protein [Bacteroidales bacterium]
MERLKKPGIAAEKKLKGWVIMIRAKNNIRVWYTPDTEQHPGLVHSGYRTTSGSGTLRALISSREGHQTKFPRPLISSRKGHRERS